MSMRRVAALQAGLLLVAISASASSLKNTVRITVLDSVTRALTSDDNNGVPQNCAQLTFDAYCRSTTNVPLVSTLLVQEGNQPPFRISCTIESRYSRCIPLPKGETFDARPAKHGFIVFYVDDKGKERKQLYTLVASDNTVKPAAAAIATQPVPIAAAPQQSSATPAPASPSPGVSVREVPGNVKCNFSSIPAGAEITLDGKYVGSTPSEIAVPTGTHVVIFSMPGFIQWKRDLTLTTGSQLTVSAILQKQ
jgi:PEGA domain